MTDPAEKMVQAAIEGNAHDFNAAFGAGMVGAVDNALDNKKMEVAGAFLSQPNQEMSTED